jgi:phospholipase/carboxylesterase
LQLLDGISVTKLVISRGEKVLDYELTETGSTPEYCVIWLHGLGADGHDFFPIVPELKLPDQPGVRFIFPHAPQQPVTINGGYVMRAWYDIVAPDLTTRQDKDGILHSAQLIGKLIDEQVQQGISREKIIVAGFSQGGAMALHIGLRESERLSGIMALSCYLPLANEMPLAKADDKRDLPIFMAHGSYDPVVPIQAGIMSREILAQLGYTVSWKDYPMEHSVCAEEIADISQWLQQVIANN